MKRFIPVPPLCRWCRHRNGDALPEDWREATCAAFPDGIPEQIISWQHYHRHPFNGDRGIRFEPRDDNADAVPESSEHKSPSREASQTERTGNAA